MLLAMSRREIRSWLMDMDGVLVREEQPIPGADRFLASLRERGTPFLVLTNNSIYTRRDLAARLRTAGLDVPEEAIWTSALATARFLEDQRPRGSAFVIGEAGLTTALHDAGYTPSPSARPITSFLARREHTRSSASHRRSV
jgi:NagD protein